MPAKRVVVTGAGGFIGTRLCHLLKAEGCRTVGLDINPLSTVCDEAFVGDLTVTGPWFRALVGTSTIFHLAGKVHSLAEVRQDEDEYFRINTAGTRNVLEAAQRAGVRRFVLFSTVKAMSRDEDESGASPCNGSRPLAEEDALEPDTPYGKSKLEAEKLVLHGGYVPEPVVLRLCMVYGAGAKGNMQKMLQAVSRHRFPSLPEVNNRRSMVHVEDVIQAALLAAERPEAVGHTFIVSDGQAYSTRQIYEWMCRALNRSCPPWRVPLSGLKALGLVGDFVGRVRGRRFIFDSDALAKLVGSAWFSSEKIQSRLGLRPQWDLKKALPEMVAEMQQRG